MSYIGNEPVISAVRTITEIVATNNQSTFTANGGYTVGFIDVFVNGSQLTASDFTATDGSTITLNEAATVNDIVRLVAWGTFQAANITSGSLSAGGITWSQAGGVTLPRIDSSNEGGQLNFNRASDNTATWSIDSFGNTSTPSLRFIDGANVRAVIDGSGNVGIGTSSPQQKLHINDSSSPRIKLTNATTGTGSSDGSEIAIFDADSSLRINNLENANILFGTNGSERMRITSGGDLLVGTSSTPSGSVGGAGFIREPNLRSTFFMASNTTSQTTLVVMRNPNGDVGTINTSGSSTAYNTSSDYRLKENVAPMQNALSVVAQLKPVTYTWKVDGSAGQGFIAHELQEVVPDCVTGEKDAVDEEGNPRYQGVDTSFLVATLTAAIQELKAELDNAKAEIELLKGAN